MSNDVYRKLAIVLDTLPNGFPSTESGIELKLLRRIFNVEEAELFCELKLTFETPQQIAQRTGREPVDLDKILTCMWGKGQIFGVEFGTVKMFKMVPWAFGIYEFQLPHMDRELAEMCEEYMKVYGRQFFDHTPQLMQVIPIEREIPGRHESLTYERVSSIVERGQSFLVNDCICKKEQGLLGHPCDKPVEVCLAIAPVPNIFDHPKSGRPISKEEAYRILDKAEEAGLVHLTWNVQNGHFFICNCCGCCCGVLRGINEMNIPASRVVNSYYVAEIDPERCIACGTCADDRCQVKAIHQVDDIYEVVPERCIGCGLCVGTCQAEAIRLVRKPEQALVIPPADEMDWYKTRARERGVDISRYT